MLFDLLSNWICAKTRGYIVLEPYKITHLSNLKIIEMVIILWILVYYISTGTVLQEHFEQTHCNAVRNLEAPKSLNPRNITKYPINF